MNILTRKHVFLALLMLLYAHTSIAYKPADPSENKNLRTLARMYPVYEKQVLSALSHFGTYQPTLDSTLITRYTHVVTQVLSKKQLTTEDRLFVKKIAALMTKGAVYRNASPDSRWRNYAKQAIIRALSTCKEGLAILDSLTANNPLLAAEREAYSLPLE